MCVLRDVFNLLASLSICALCWLTCDSQVVSYTSSKVVWETCKLTERKRGRESFSYKVPLLAKWYSCDTLRVKSQVKVLPRPLINVYISLSLCLILRDSLFSLFRSVTTFFLSILMSWHNNEDLIQHDMNLEMKGLPFGVIGTWGLCLMMKKLQHKTNTEFNDQHAQRESIASESDTNYRFYVFDLKISAESQTCHPVFRLIRVVRVLQYKSH